MAFPTSPSNDDLHTEFGRTFKYSSASNSWSAATPDAPPETAPTTLGITASADLPLTNVIPGTKAFSTEENKLFLATGNGWFEIALLENTSPTITTGADASYALSSDGTPTVVTLSATDPEGVPITWGYQVTSGSLKDTTVTNEGGVFTITPGATDATFNLAFTASDGVNIDTSASSFSLTFLYNFAVATEHVIEIVQNPANPGGCINNQYVVLADQYANKVYVYDASTRQLLHTINSPIPSIGFGIRVDIDGDNILVGATHDESEVTGRGSAFIYSASTGQLVRRLLWDNTTDPAGSVIKVSISETYAAISSGYVAGYSGRVVVFDIYTGNVLYTLSGASNSMYGDSVSVTDQYLVVGSPNEDNSNGRAYVYSTSTGTLLYTLYDNLPGTESKWEAFGSDVSISGNLIAVTAPAEKINDNANKLGLIYVYQASTGNLLQSIQSPGNTNARWGGYGTGLSINNGIIAIGNSNHYAIQPNGGLLYIFDVGTDGSKQDLLKTIVFTNPDSIIYPGFGRTVHSKSSSQILVLAENTISKAYIYKAPAV